MNLKSFFQSNPISKIVLILLVLLIILVVFQAGFIVGYHKGAFSSNLDRNYMRGPDDPRSFFDPFMHDGDDVNPHGAIGEIVSMNLPVIMIKGPRMAEETIIVSANTTIRNFRQIASTSDLTVGGALSLQSGTLVLNNHNLTLNGTLGANVNLTISSTSATHFTYVNGNSTAYAGTTACDQNRVFGYFHSDNGLNIRLRLHCVKLNCFF